MTNSTSSVEEIHLPNNKPLFYLFGIVYNTIIIFLGSIYLSLLNFIIYVGAAIVSSIISPFIAIGNLLAGNLMMFLTLIPLSGVGVAMTYCVVGMATGHLALFSVPVLLTFGPLVGLSIGFGTGYLVYHLVIDLISGVSSSSLDFYNYRLYGHGMISAFISPFKYLSSRPGVNENVDDTIAYHYEKNNELVLNAYVEKVNYYQGTIISLERIPESLKRIMIDYLYEELIEIGKQVFPAWLPQKIVGLKAPSFFNDLREWVEGRPLDEKNKHILTQSDGEEMLASCLRSHGVIQRKLELLSKGSSKKKSDANDQDTIYLLPTIREIDGEPCYVGLYANEPIDENSTTANMIMLKGVIKTGRELTHIYSFDVPRILKAISQQGHPVYKQPSQNSHTTTAPLSYPKNR